LRNWSVTIVWTRHPEGGSLGVRRWNEGRRRWQSDHHRSYGEYNIIEPPREYGGQRRAPQNWKNRMLAVWGCQKSKKRLPTEK
jgi:hypothetical protein